METTQDQTRRSWRSRLPSLVAGVGATLVTAAVVGFASSSWTELGTYAQSITLAITCAALSMAALWGQGSDRQVMRHVTILLWATGSATLAGAVWLAGSTASPDAGRAVIAAAGIAGAVHAGSMWQTRRDSIVLQMATFAAGIYAAGPLGTSLADRYDLDRAENLFDPIAGLFDPLVTSDGFAIVAGAHLVLGILWLASTRLLPRRAAITGRVLASILIAYAALSFNVMAAPIGAAIALLVVLAYFIVGVATEDGLLVIGGFVGILVSGVRVLFSLFTGEVAVTVTIFAAGVLMLAWAYHSAQRDTQEA